MPKGQMDLLRGSWFLLCVLAPCLASLDGWSDWSIGTQCSRSCGGGVQTENRSCLLREGSRGNDECQGSATRYISCNSQPCPRGTKDFRLQQCRAYNGEALYDTSIKNSTWEPVYDLSKPCELICTAQNGETRTFRPEVIDGTECDSARELGICVRGVCKRVGCDRILSSDKREDKCLVCDGNGSDCYTAARSTSRRRIPPSTFCLPLLSLVFCLIESLSIVRMCNLYITAAILMALLPLRFLS
ncbi:A disintegrin and metalloproteinase with thrombospondin motifs 6 [Elysia marginata]|uniref:A disintegrin and metalloproteinase with thrombospondin motifs 6 n=1 Tax=Elysia marginata TaxID=1093978 RepID=A0AAV4GCL8_9GAST|nr:A disintegrin and metalloproteinase with thrombospondin motifs 6 [Elysia marginata]